MKLIQLKLENNSRVVGVIDNNKIFNITAVSKEIDTTYKLFEKVINGSKSLIDFVEELVLSSPELEFTYDQILESTEKLSIKLLPAIDHPDPYRLFISGTGLTHTGSVKSRDMMHNENDSKKELTDSAKMFEMGLKGGKPKVGKVGVAPEWFYKGNGLNLRGPKDKLIIPNFSLDGGEEPEIVGCYFIDKHGNPVRIGFTLGNEFSDHETEQINYLYLAHSKLRNCSIGAEVNTSLDFSDITVNCDVFREDVKIYESGNLKSGEEFMSHSLSNMEYHHFKYDLHRNPGDLHLHFFGTSQLSYSTRKWKFETGDKIIISSDQFDGFLENSIEKVTDKRFQIKKV